MPPGVESEEVAVDHVAQVIEGNPVPVAVRERPAYVVERQALDDAGVLGDVDIVVVVDEVAAHHLPEGGERERGHEGAHEGILFEQALGSGRHGPATLSRLGARCNSKRAKRLARPGRPCRADCGAVCGERAGFHRIGRSEHAVCSVGDSPIAGRGREEQGLTEGKGRTVKPRSGAKVIIESFVQEAVDAVFGIPGGAVIDIFDELNKSPVNFYLTRHEQGAAHAADGYARATGKVGVCIATSGPGATNLVTGLATANMDSVPVVALTGQVPTSMIGNDAFQEAYTSGITRSITKHNYLVKDVNDLPRILKEAFLIAATGRPGPVAIDIPKDVQQALTSVPYPKEIEIRGYKPTVKGHLRQIRQVADAIKKAKKPVILAGGGVIASGAHKELHELATRARIPVTTTLMGLGTFPETDPLALKMLGMHGTAYANYAMVEADLIISVGARFDDRITGKLSEFAVNADIVHIDIDPTSIGKSVPVDIPVVGDARAVLRELLKILEPPRTAAWLKKIAKWKKEQPLAYKDDDALRPQYVIEQVCALTKGDAVITTEVGQNQMWAAQFYTYTKPRTFLSSGGLGTMGYGLPAAIGAQAGLPGATVVDIAGDGSIQMNIQELATACLNDLPVKVMILNNGYLGMVRQWQELFYAENYSFTCLRRGKDCPEDCDHSFENCPKRAIPDFVKLAEAYGAVGIRVTKKKDVVPAIKKALATKKPVIVDFIVEREENVYPMVPSGGSLKHMMGGMA
ncbi:MAG: biosynthetic-type acetolactate synthase large subunit [Candidatus Hydrogenedentes bacterium]|nr:biosynthetic-type acetolactate synthase large subunit [Candidatus Hydrogenedentota bacterium]